MRYRLELLHSCGPTECGPEPRCLGDPTPVPAAAGTYAWYFKQLPAAIDTTRCVSWSELTLLYVGISPKVPPVGGVGASRQNLRRRLRQHYALNAYGSTLRLTLATAAYGTRVTRPASTTMLRPGGDCSQLDRCGRAC